MESVRDEQYHGELNAQAQLTMLADVQNAADVEAWMPRTPVWHAPLLATFIAGVALVNDGPNFGWAVVGAVLGGLAMILGLVDQRRRQRVWPRRSPKPLRIVAFYVFIVAVTFGIAVLWNSVEWPDGAGARLRILVGAWLATTLAFGSGIIASNWLRDRWAGSPR